MWNDESGIGVMMHSSPPRTDLCYNDWEAVLPTL